MQARLAVDLDPVAHLLAVVTGDDDWTVSLDDHYNAGFSPLPDLPPPPKNVTAAGVTTYRDTDGARWDGAITEEKAISDAELRASVAFLIAQGTLPPTVVVDDKIMFWDKHRREWAKLTPALRLAYQVRDFFALLQA